MVLIHTQKGNGDWAIKVVSNITQCKNSTDKSGYKSCIDLKDTISIGKSIYEYSNTLKLFSQYHGKHWKSTLRGYWINGVYERNAPYSKNIHELQRLRNLEGFSL